MTDDENREGRCAGCGKPMSAGEDLVRIATGSMSASKGWREKKQWGILHVSCFNKSIDSPEAVMDEIRRMQAARRTRKAG